MPPHRPIKLADWPSAIVDTGFDFEIDTRFFGYQVRTDQWRCRGWRQDWHVIHLFIDGGCTYRAGGVAHQMAPGSACWLSPGAELEAAWPPRLVFTEVWFRLREGARHLRLGQDALFVHGAWDLLPLLQQIEDEISLQRVHRDSKLRHLLALVMLELRRMTGERARPHGLGGAQRSRLAQYVQQHLRHSIRPSDLARAVDLSVDYFSRVFRRTYGCPPREWLVRERTRAAVRLLLQTTQTVYQIADTLGYASVAQFSRQFKQQFGVSPRDYRRRP